MTTRTRPAGVDESAAAAPRLLDPRTLPVVAGVLALVTLGAFENRAVTTVLPAVVRDLDGWGLFGAAGGASLVAVVVATTWAGGWTDRRGPTRVLLTGLVVFAVAQAVSALAPTMAVFVAGRALSGVAEALVDVSLMVLVARALPEALRAKVFATFAAAWILPSLLGPGLAGALDALAGWRVVFVGPLVIVPLALHLVRPALRGVHARTSPALPDEGGRGRAAASVLLAAGLAVATFSAPLLTHPTSRPLGLTVAVAGAALVAIGAGHALPPGTARLAPGVPAVVGVRLLVTAAFTGAGATIPLMLVTIRDASTALAGVSLSVTGTMWAAGSWWSSSDAAQRRFAAATRVRAGAMLIAVGSAGPVLIALDVVGVVAGLAGWALAAAGMGVASPTLSTELLRVASPGEQGRASAAQGLAMSTGVALQTGLVGAVVAWQGSAIEGPTFAVLMGTGAALAGLAALGCRRLSKEGLPDGPVAARS